MFAFIAFFEENSTLTNLYRVHRGAKRGRLGIIKGGKEWGASYDFIFLRHIGSLLVWQPIGKIEKMRGLSIGF